MLHAMTINFPNGNRWYGRVLLIGCSQTQVRMILFCVFCIE